ncbi:sulfatase family protein [Dyadobacter bucti]|uniref:sulfatase family protein n=1 Tax=Dyadobacter bucti TaxID=2572203 RepID=UPI001E4D499A|nr:arylsulfatase [Dyadobacter bucti]
MMNLKYKTIAAAAVPAALLVFSAYLPETKNVQASAAVKPNIVVILADDLGYGDLQCYNPESQTSTPNLDRLSREGLRFTDAHSGSAVCTPTRYGLITGRYAFRSPLKKGVLGGYSPALIEENRFTVADLMKQSGYQTAVIGKWHLGLNWPERDASQPQPGGAPDSWPAGDKLNIKADLLQGPNDLGFDYSYIIPSSLDIPPYIYLENGRPTNRDIGEIEGKNDPRGVFWRSGKAAGDFKLEQTLDHLGSKAKEFLIGQSKTKQPFFLYLPLTSPHTPWLPSKGFQGKSGAGIYGDFVAHTDDVVGQVVRTLDSLGLKDNTLIVFTSDNGADWKPGDKEKFPKHQANGILRGQKSDIWEGGHRVPFIVRWPGAGRKPGTVSETVCLTDLMSTFASLTGRKIPANAGQDSFDFSPVLSKSGSGKPVRQSIIHHSINGMFAIRKGRWKYVEGQGSGGWSRDESATKELTAQLYDIENDPRETQNLVQQKPEIARELKTLLLAQQDSGFTREGAVK